MSISTHLQELRKKHQVLSDRVEAAQRSPGSDPLQLAALKKQKLMLKEEIHRLTPGEV
ncbi:MAG: YdcH family protein [Qingshengfaniella sp.]